jgi:hypothetical protein
LNLDTGRRGHWYGCKNSKCDLKIPLPDNIFIDLDANEYIEAECKCGNKNFFNFSDAGDKTRKWQVDKYLGMKSPRFKFYWESGYPTIVNI